MTYDVVKELLEYQTSNPEGTTSSEPMEDDELSGVKGSPALSSPKTKKNLRHQF